MILKSRIYLWHWRKGMKGRRNVSINLKEIKSQHELNDGKRSSDVLLSAIDELEELRKENEAFEKLATNLEKDCERLLKQLEIAIEGLKKYESGVAYSCTIGGVTTGSMPLAADRGQTARKYLKRIEELNND